MVQAMKILLSEYTVVYDPILAPEGHAMLEVLQRSFERCGHEVILPEGNDLAREIAQLAPSCDMGLVIAPDHLLAHLTRILEKSTHNLGCGSMNAALCANKQKTGRVLTAHGISVPKETSSGKKVVKPVLGCGSQGVRLTRDPPGEGEFAQEYIEGEHLSVSLIAGRVVGEACLYYRGKRPLVLALNRQHIIMGNGQFLYDGGETPIHHPREEEIAEVAKKSVEILGCQGYTGVDVVVSDQVYVVDVNPRITTSVVGIAAMMEEEIGELLIRASQGDVPDTVHFQGTVRFSKNGRLLS
jgi:predicted ATP-grasp superfamily ATP-dependent carboligase